MVCRTLPPNAPLREDLSDISSAVQTNAEFYPDIERRNQVAMETKDGMLPNTK